MKIYLIHPNMYHINMIERFFRSLREIIFGWMLKRDFWHSFVTIKILKIPPFFIAHVFQVLNSLIPHQENPAKITTTTFSFAFAKLVERLLTFPHCGRRFTRRYPLPTISNFWWWGQILPQHTRQPVGSCNKHLYGYWAILDRFIDFMCENSK